MAWTEETSARARREPRIRGALELAESDPRLGEVIRAVGPPAPLGNPSTFATLARSIVYQQLSRHAAAAIWGRLGALFEGGEALPAPLLRKRESTLRGVGLSAMKVAALRDLARHVEDGRLDPEGFARRSDEEVVAAITQVRGLGVWSAQMHLIFSLGRMDVWPALDLGVRKGWARLHGHGRVPEPKAAEPLGEPWRPWRTIAAWYLWRLLELPAPEPGRRT